MHVRFSMPELPEVETTVRGLAPVLEGRRIASIELRRADLRRPFPPDLRQRLTGARVTGLGRRAKYGLIDTDRGDTMIFHLGMSGHWRIDPAEIGTHDHVADRDRRGPAARAQRSAPVRLARPRAGPTSSTGWPPFARWARSRSATDFDGAYLARALDGRTAPIKALLLDQRIVAGLGNIYVCDALNLAADRAGPGRRAGSPAPGSTGSPTAVKSVLRAAIDGRRLEPARLCPARWRARLFLEANGGSMAARASHARAAPRRFAAGSTRGRSTFYCPKCQR